MTTGKLTSYFYLKGIASIIIKDKERDKLQQEKFDLDINLKNITTKIHQNHEPYIWFWCSFFVFVQHLHYFCSRRPCFTLFSIRPHDIWGIIHVCRAVVELWPTLEPITCTNWPWIRSILLNWSFWVHWKQLVSSHEL